MYQVPTVPAVKGMTRAQYSQILLDIDQFSGRASLPGVNSKKLVLKSDWKDVRGKSTERRSGSVKGNAHGEVSGRKECH